MAEDIQINSPLRYNTEDFKYSVKPDVFAGRVSMSVFENAAKSGPIIKCLFTPQSATQFKIILKKILSDPESHPIELGFWPWNKDMKQNEFRSSIKVGRDQEKAIYLEFAGDKHKDPIRFYVTSDTGIRINSMVLPKQSLTETGCQALIELVTSLMNAALYSPSNRQGGNGNFTAAQEPTTPGINDDIGF